MIIATAGHVDHGKTKLIEAITGVNSDRLPEEKNRGMSIDLGFAYHDLGNGVILNFIDVPGHERFINNLLSGFSNVDLGLLVIAADDGPMPQTEEHLSILQLLQVKNCIIVLTKIDKVNQKRLDNVCCLIKKMMHKTIFSDAEIFHISNKTSQGIDNLVSHLKIIALNYHHKEVKGNFRLSVDRRFLVKGAGIVITGTVVSGEVSVGEELIHSKSGESLKIRAIHSQSKKSKNGIQGHRCSLNITGQKITIDKISRGDWILSKNVFFVTNRLDAVLSILKNEKKIFKHWTAIHLYLGSGNVTGRIAILGSFSINPGEKKIVQLVLDKPVHAVFDDKFVIRDISSSRTIGGGYILDPFAKKNNNTNFRNFRSERLKLISPNSSKIVLNNLLLHYIEGIGLKYFLMSRNLTASEFEKIIELSDIVTELYKKHKWLILKTNWICIQKIILDKLLKKDQPLSGQGMELNTILKAIKLNVPNFVVQNILNESLKSEKIKKFKNLFFHPYHFSSYIKNMSWWFDIEKKFKKYGFQPPKIREISLEIGIDLKALEPILNKALSFGYLVKINKSRYILTSCFKDIGCIFEEIFNKENIEKINVQMFSQHTKISRNLSIEILEYFDEIGFTKRLDEGRVILKPFKNLKFFNTKI